MILRNTIVGAIQDAVIQDGEVKTDSWPEQLELEGFIYRRLRGFGAEGKAKSQIAMLEVVHQRLAWRDKPFSPSPYEQLADMLYKLGYRSKANAILYEAVNDRAAHYWSEVRKLRGWPLDRVDLLQYTIGYRAGAGISGFMVVRWNYSYRISCFTWIN
jgi:hypothetical protein